MSVAPLPLRLWPSLAATLLITSIGGMLMGSCAYGLQKTGIESLASVGLFAMWPVTAGCLYAANQQWIGRDPGQRPGRFMICLLLAVPIQLATIIVAVNVLERLGGHL
jgi:hypothetical protein